MENNNKPGKSFRPIAGLFILVILVALIARNWLSAQFNVDYIVLLGGNIVLFAATVLSFSLYSKSLRSSNPQVFLRMMYSSLLIKMGFCLLATLLYLYFGGKDVNKPGIIACLVLYMLYTYLEVKVLMRLMKNSPKNG